MARTGRKNRAKLPRGAPAPAASRQQSAYTVTRLDQLKALSHPLRQRLFEQFARAPRTTKQVADRLGEKATRLYHHVAALEQAGLIELVATRPVRGTTEKYYEAIARTVRIDPAVLAGDESGAAQVAGLELVDGVLGKVRGDIAALLAREQEGADTAEDEVLLMQVDIAGSEREVRRIRAKIDKLVAELKELDSAAPEADAGSHRLLIGWYPTPRDEGD